MKSSQLSILVAILIVVYGTFGQLLLPHFQSFLETYIFLKDDILVAVKSFLIGRTETELDAYNLGRYLIYIPIYIGLHVVLINSLFWNNRRSRKIANVTFFGILISLVLLILTSYWLQITSLYEFFMGLFNKFIKLPLILFLVEGGRILIKDIDRKISLKNNTSTKLTQTESRKE